MAETVEEAVARAARTITRDQARDPAKYREVAAAAREQGKEIIWLDPSLPDPAPEAKLDVVYLKDSIVLRREAVRDPRDYRKVRDEAERSHRSMVMVEDLTAIADEDLQRRVNAAVAGKDPGTLRATEDPYAAS